MSPVIVTTGSKEIAFRIELLKGEPFGAERGAPAKTVFSASSWFSIGENTKAERDFTMRLGMGSNMAEELVKAAEDGTEGVSITFETVFKRGGGTEGPKTYKNFILNRPK